MRRTSNFLSISVQNLLRTMFLGSRLSSGGVPAKIIQMYRDCDRDFSYQIFEIFIRFYGIFRFLFKILKFEEEIKQHLNFSEIA